MKKRFLAFTVALCCALTVVPIAAANAWIGDSYMSPDEGFAAFLAEVGEEAGYSYEEVSHTRETLYDTRGEVSGYLYDFVFDGKTEGFLCLVKLGSGSTAVYEMTEIYFETASPYAGFTGTRLYPTFSTYLVENDGVYTDVLNGITVPLAVVQELEQQGFGFSGDVNYIQNPITINFDYKNDIISGISSIPTYSGTSSLGGNGCASLAGSCIIGYYDRYKTDLIPDWDPGFTYGVNYYWKGQMEKVSAMIDQLYLDMQTNTTGDGVTIDQYKSGLKTYAASHGNYNVTFRNVMSNNNYEFNAIESELKSSRPIALFLNPYYNYTDRNGVQEDNKSDTWLTISYYGSHVMTAYGTRNVNYYNVQNQLIRSDKYLKVAGAKVGNADGYIRLTDTYCTLRDAFSVEIA